MSPGCLSPRQNFLESCEVLSLTTVLGILAYNLVRGFAECCIFVKHVELWLNTQDRY